MNHQRKLQVLARWAIACPEVDFYAAIHSLSVVRQADSLDILFLWQDFVVLVAISHLGRLGGPEGDPC
jgi:hypothetical protein